MKKCRLLLGLVVPALLSACADMDTALFATSSSIGINVDSKPPTVSIAYDRTEGFLAPRFANGGTPSAVASIETGGSVFDPNIRQVYATGAAANKATIGPTAPDGPTDLSGDPAKKQLMFFGTGTTIGIKVGFGTSGAPDSLVFGYRRKEVSVIPLAIQSDGKAVYPSVLASIDMTSNMKSLEGTGLASKQFFATGRAAEALATNPAVSTAFAVKAEDAVLAGLSEDDQKKAKALGVGHRTTADDKLSKIMTHLTVNGALDPEKLKKLVNDANKDREIVRPELKKETTLDGLRNRIHNVRFEINALFSAIPAT